MNDSGLANKWLVAAESLKSNINLHLWDEDEGRYRDNTTTTLLPQDGNSLALLFNLTTSQSQKERVSAGLQKNWVKLGAVGPEQPEFVVPFVSGFEVRNSLSQPRLLLITIVRLDSSPLRGRLWRTCARPRPA